MAPYPTPHVFQEVRSLFFRPEGIEDPAVIKKAQESETIPQYGIRRLALHPGLAGHGEGHKHPASWL